MVHLPLQNPFVKGFVHADLRRLSFGIVDRPTTQNICSPRITASVIRDAKRSPFLGVKRKWISVAVTSESSHEPTSAELVVDGSFPAFRLADFRCWFRRGVGLSVWLKGWLLINID